MMQYKKRFRYTCEICGKIFEVIYSRLKYVRYCSKKCKSVATGIRFASKPSHYKGKHLTEEHRKNISISLKGKKCIRRKTYIPWNKGIKMPKEYCDKLSIAGKGKHGNPKSEEHRKKLSDIRKGKWSGDKNPKFNGWSSRKPYCEKWTFELKEAVRDKYGRRCFLCDLDERYNKEHRGKVRRLSVHHIDGDKQQGCNGKSWFLVPLCLKCHLNILSNEKYWMQQIVDLLKFYTIKDVWIWWD